ncbi:hypothetical protein VTJ83DRAFT_6476 [Remersonia thermophila]|uniref:Nicotinamide riboside kinase n=1 Tax=Remersonia thermophila TaxID=72144 RepID=A0ABR4D4T6_9PEZI
MTRRGSSPSWVHDIDVSFVNFTMDKPRTILIGISGCSSSGKTTLARLLRDWFPETFILHEDDFYKPESELPQTHGFVDWDCPEAISIPDLEAALVHIRATGTLPPTLNSKEDLNSVGPSPLTPARRAALESKVRAWLQPGRPGADIFPPPSPDGNAAAAAAAAARTKTRICILEGFLLFSPPRFSAVMALLDVKLFLRASKRAALDRRARRDGYVTLEGFWADPPGYVDRVVWPGYVKHHRWMFVGAGHGRGDGDAGEDDVVDGGVLDQDVLRKAGIHAMADRGEDVDFGDAAEWAVGVVMEELERICLGQPKP